MRPFSSTLPLDRALEIIERAVTPVESVEEVPLEAAAGRVLARDIEATLDVPPFDRSAMDGYAVSGSSTTGASPSAPVSLEIALAIYAGDAPGGTADLKVRPTSVGQSAAAVGGIAPGQCCEIATGAPLPPGADAVVMVEETERDDAGRVLLRKPVAAFENVGRRGSDIRAGTIALERGAFLTAGRVGLLAALGVSTVRVHAKPVVALASSGNEVVTPGRALEPGQIYDVNAATLKAVVEAHGGVARVYPPARDTLADLEGLLDAMAGAHLVVVSGGSSVGERDLLVDALAQRGEVLFHGIAVKPGKPTLFGRIGPQLVLGMPGNPTSCLSNAYILLVPLLRTLARLPVHRPEVRRLPLGAGVRSTPDRHQFYPVRVARDEAVPVFKGSSDITSLSDADGYIEIPIGVGSVAAGTIVEVKLF
jgi:molybdenum cofactor synthesis domain-containing protein